MPSKSIYRRPGAQHFQLVHRSQRDPLIYDSEASQHVLKPFQRENDVRKGKSRADLENLLAPLDLAHDTERANIGEATLYGVYYDDTDYDYMQHLRDTGVKEDNVETIMIEAPASSSKAMGKAKVQEAIQLRLPPEVLPSSSELDRAQTYDAQQAIPDAISGFQPDMDPHLRQVLEALEEDAFVDEELSDDFFEELVTGGERSHDEVLEYEFREDGIQEGDTGLNDDDSREGECEEDSEKYDPWEVRFALFKKQQRDTPEEAGGSESDELSEGGDTVRRLPVIGGKKRRRGAASESSGFSMTSSAVYRNEGLSTLDERYDQIEKSYQEDDDNLPDDLDEDENAEDDDEAPDLLAAREDFEAILDDFLDNYELVGRRMRPVLPGDTAAEKLQTIRRGLGGMRINPGAEDDDDDDDAIPMPYDIDEKKDRWDCETILSTYTNLENHPRLIRARDDRPVPKIRLDARTGLPSTDRPQQKQILSQLINEDEAEEDNDVFLPVRVTIARPRDESIAEKKARKQAVKQERQARRVDKKAVREQFSTERKHQVKMLANKQSTGIKKL